MTGHAGIGALFCILVTFSASLAAAQPATWTAGGIGGFGKTWNDESQVGTGLLGGARLDGRLVGGLRLEGAVDWLRHNRDEGAFQSDGHTTFLTATVRYQFGDGATYGYILGGPAIAFHSGTNTFEGESRHVSGTSTGWTFGGGMAGPAGSRLEIGPEARFVMLASDDGSNTAFAIYGGIRIVLKR